MKKGNFKNLLINNVTERYKIWFLIPMLIFLIAACVFTGFAVAGKDFSKGLNIGIDFSSGNILTVHLGEDSINKFDENSKTISNIITKNGGTVSYVQTTGSGDNAAIAFKYANFKENLELQKESNEKISAEILEAYKNIEANNIKVKSMGATASKDLVGKAFLSVFISTLIILIYVAFRFKLWSGVSAVLALIHDVFFMVALTIIFRIQINATFIAALITIVAYSINDTIVVFDRIRENMKINETEGNKLSVNKVVNNSVRQTLQRSINTTITTLASIVLLAIIGVASIREFALPVIFGLIGGVFSSIYVAPSIYCLIINGIKKHKDKTLKPYEATKKVTK